MERRGRRLSGLGAIAGIVLALTTVAPVPGSAAPSSVPIAAPRVSAPSPGVPCRDVVYLGARGSGQEHGLGAQIQSAYDRLQYQLSPAGRTTAYHALNYPARGVPVNLLGWRAFFRGIDEGVREGTAWVEQRVKDCPDERMVLAGYSQGAMVMHRVLNNLITARATAALARIDGAVLVADGDRIRNDNTTDHGTARARAEGVGTFWTSLSGTGRTTFPRRLQTVVHSVCNRNDPVCDSYGLLADLAWVGVHLKYTGSPELYEAVDAVADAVRSRPKPGYMTVSGAVGEAIHTQLTADVTDGYTLQWSVLPPAVMPSGLSLSAGGLVSGTSAAPLSGFTPVRVRGVILGVSTPWVDTEITWSVTNPPPPDQRPVWTSATLPVPDATGGVDVGTPACDARGNCVVTGRMVDNPAEVLWSLRGGTWSMHPLPGPAEDGDPGTAACSPEGTCLAYFRRSAFGDIDDSLWRYTPSGGWSPVTLSAPEGVNRNGTQKIDSVQCTGGDVCLVVGRWWRTGSGSPSDDESYAVWTYRAGRWATATPTLPGDAQTSSPAGDPAQARVQAAGCDQSGSCTIGGSYWAASAAQGSRTRAVFWATFREGRWSSHRSALPDGARASSSLEDDPSIGDPGGLGCGLRTCAAIGTFALQGDSHGNPGFRPLLWSNSSGSWTASRPQLPDGTLGGDDRIPVLVHVACGATGVCAAIGEGRGLVGYPPLVWELQGSAWRVAEPDLPAGTEGRRGQTFLASVACATAGGCVLGGSQFDDRGTKMTGLVWSGARGSGGWTVSQPLAAWRDISGASVRCASDFCSALASWTGYDAGRGYRVGTIADGGWSFEDAPGIDDSDWVGVGGAACGPQTCLQMATNYGTDRGWPMSWMLAAPGPA